MNEEMVMAFLKNGFLISPDLFEQNNNINDEQVNAIKGKLGMDKALVIHSDIIKLIEKTKGFDINWLEFEKSKASREKGKDAKIYHTFLDILDYNTDEKKQEQIKVVLEEIKKPEILEVIKPRTEKIEPSAVVIKSHSQKVRKREMQHFVSYFNARYEHLKKFLQNRTELGNLTSINRIIGKTNKDQVSIIGIVYDKITTKNGNLMFTLEDPTGHINILVNKNKERLWNIARDISHDEVIGINGVCGGKILFVNDITFPDIMINTEPKRSPDEVYAAYISDVHVGSRLFLSREFEKFVNWINGKVGNAQQKDIAKKVKYLFIVGDIVDGVGIYPEQDKELDIKDIYAQYDKCAKILSELRDDVKLIMCPGNHDACRLSEPQPALKEVAKPLIELPNSLNLSNPAYVNIHSSEDFPGFNVLMYHGYSYDFYASEIESIRQAGGCDRSDLIMKYLLQRRHLAPTHSSTLYIPETEEDPLIIDRVPDIFSSGHLHKSALGNYNGIITIATSCWQAKTPFQEKMGHEPDPGKVPLLNLKTREIKMMKF